MCDFCEALEKGGAYFFLNAFRRRIQYLRTHTNLHPRLHLLAFVEELLAGDITCPRGTRLFYLLTVHFGSVR